MPHTAGSARTAALRSWLTRAALAGALLGAGLAARLPPTVAAQGGIQVVAAPAPVYEFGRAITFHVTAASPASITAATLFVNTGGLTPAVWRSAPFHPAARVEAVVSFDLGLNPLLPFAQVSYWWQISDGAGQKLNTAPTAFTYEDNRFAWHTLTSGSVTLHWYQGDAAFGQAAVTIATNALPILTQDVRAPLPEHVNVYVYATDGDVRSALGRVAVAYANGHADPKLGVVIISVAPDLRANYNLQIQLPHELTHVLVYRAAGGNYSRAAYVADLVRFLVWNRVVRGWAVPAQAQHGVALVCRDAAVSRIESVPLRAPRPSRCTLQ